MKKGTCPICHKENARIVCGVCHNCYRREIWKRKKIKCKRCQRLLPMKAKGLCGGCYNIVFCLEYAKAWNYKKWYGLEISDYKKITEKCVVCGFDKIVDLHHLDQNHKNNSKSNLVGLCPNHHKMYHSLEYGEEIKAKLKERLSNQNVLLL